MNWFIITILSFALLIVCFFIGDKLDNMGFKGLKYDIIYLLIVILFLGLFTFSLIASFNSKPCGDVYYSIAEDEGVVVKISGVAKDGNDYIVSFYDGTVDAIHTEWDHSFDVKMTKEEYNNKIESGITSIVTTRYNINYLSESEYLGIRCFPRAYTDFKYEFMDGVVDESDLSVKTFYKGLKGKIGTLKIRFNFDRYVSKNGYVKIKEY